MFSQYPVISDPFRAGTEMHSGACWLMKKKEKRRKKKVY
jgi:hypothetical protein